jgi:hypothetical protein
MGQAHKRSNTTHAPLLRARSLLRPHATGRSSAPTTCPPSIYRPLQLRDTRCTQRRSPTPATFFPEQASHHHPHQRLGYLLPEQSNVRRCKGPDHLPLSAARYPPLSSYVILVAKAGANGGGSAGGREPLPPGAATTLKLLLCSVVSAMDEEWMNYG